jgi:hypothetical protein
LVGCVVDKLLLATTCMQLGASLIDLFENFIKGVRPVKLHHVLVDAKHALLIKVLFKTREVGLTLINFELLARVFILFVEKPFFNLLVELNSLIGMGWHQVDANVVDVV